MYKVLIKKEGGDWQEAGQFEDFQAAGFYAWSAQTAAAMALRKVETMVVECGARCVVNNP